MESKNLFDTSRQIDNIFKNIQGETVIGIEMNGYTLNFLKSKNIYGFGNIPLIINNNLDNFMIKVYREKNSEITEYVPCKIKEE